MACLLVCAPLRCRLAVSTYPNQSGLGDVFTGLIGEHTLLLLPHDAAPRALYLLACGALLRKRCTMHIPSGLSCSMQAPFVVGD